MMTSRRSILFLIVVLASGCTAPLILAESPQDDVVPLVPEVPPNESSDAGDAPPSDIGVAADGDAAADGGQGGFDGVHAVPDASAEKG